MPASTDLGYDASGNITSKNASVFTNSSNGTWTYAYDGASRMTQAVLDYPGTTPASTQWDYAYDGAGNRTQIKQMTPAIDRDLEPDHHLRCLGASDDCFRRGDRGVDHLHA
jgi:hypothetical protein